MFDLVRPEDMRQSLNGGFLPSADRKQVVHIREMRYDEDDGGLLYYPEYADAGGRHVAPGWEPFDLSHFCYDVQPVLGTVNRPLWPSATKSAVHVQLHPERQWRKVLSARARYSNLVRRNGDLNGDGINLTLAYAMYFPHWYTAGQALQLVASGAADSAAINKHLAVARHGAVLLLSYDGMLVGTLDGESGTVALHSTAQHLLEQVADHFTVQRAGV